MGEDPLANAGYAVTGSGGGGSDGRYMFASLEEMDGVIADWAALRDRIAAREQKLMRAKGLIAPPAEDPMSEEHAKVVGHSLDKALTHNRAMRAYAEGYVTKLRASRDQYLSTDDDAAARLRNVDEG